MLGYILVDIPVDDPIEIDEYGMVAEVTLKPETMTMREDLNIHIERAEVRPMPTKKGFYGKAYAYNCMAQGWNECLDEITGETE